MLISQQIVTIIMLVVSVGMTRIHINYCTQTSETQPINLWVWHS